MKFSTTASAIFAAAILASTSLVTAAFAANPHFIKTPTITKNPDLSLTASFKAAGLGNVATDIFLASSGGVADLQCVNPGGNNPPPKRVDFGPLQGQVVTVTPRNGQVTANPTIGPPPLPGAAEICPNPNWTVQIVSLTYTDVVLHIQQGGVDILTFNFGDVDP
ncbi:hypothetical protein [Candidatus Nitrososphaera sp. FF02]|uniref:hypothetical protein n=1 Tax=Candidatus Nitrososphaera sp. FF02 TaxID=3398226 RepID=UPI0039EB0D49